MKVWFQNRRTKHKREETETEQSQALKGTSGHAHEASYAAQTMIEEEDDEDIDCEWVECVCTQGGQNP